MKTYTEKEVEEKVSDAFMRGTKDGVEHAKSSPQTIELIKNFKLDINGQISGLRNLMQTHINDNIDYRIKRQKEDDAFKKQFEPMLRVYNTSIYNGRALLWISSIIVAVGSAWLIILRILK